MRKLLMGILVIMAAVFVASCDDTETYADQRNRERDHRDYQALARLGWHTIVIWECSLKPASVRQRTLESLEQTLYHIFLADRQLPAGPSRTLQYPLHGEEDGTDEKLAAEP